MISLRMKYQVSCCIGPGCHYLSVSPHGCAKAESSAANASMSSELVMLRDVVPGVPFGC